MTIATIQDQIALLEEKEQRLLSEDKIDVDELNIVRNRLSELRLAITEQQQIEVQKVERVEAAIIETATVVDNLEIMPGITLRDIIADPEAYQLVSIAFKTKMNEKANDYINELTEMKNAQKEELRAASERESNLQFQLRTKDQNIDELNEANAELRKQVNTLTFERDKALEVRDNAAAELEGMKLSIAEKDKHIDTLRTEIAVGAKGAVQVDQTEQLRRAAEEWKNSRIKVTNIRWSDPIKQREYNAELVSNGETITFNRLEKGKYLEVSADEAERFRAEAAKQTDAAVETVHDIPLVEEVVAPVIAEVHQFPEETGLIVVEGHEVADIEQGVQLPTEERISKLEKLVQGLEEDVAILYGRNGQVA